MLCLVSRRHGMLVASLSEFLTDGPHRFVFFKLVAEYDRVPFRRAAVATDAASPAAPDRRYHHHQCQSSVCWIAVPLR
jgi:hypothetical protein